MGIMAWDMGRTFDRDLEYEPANRKRCIELCFGDNGVCGMIGYCHGTEKYVIRDDVR